MGRYSIGIDLGTTNCALSYLDTASAAAGTRVLPLPQPETEGVERELDTLPSFLYLPPPEAKPRAPAVPAVAGALARAQSALTPGRVIASAKSWLCQGEASPLDRFLPWGST